MRHSQNSWRPPGSPLTSSAPEPAAIRARDTRSSWGDGMRRKITLLPLIAATYFIVAGGPFGLEDTVSRAGYAGAIAILLLTPLIWALPTALMVSEMTSAVPEEGGYYVYVTRAMGPFWGFQEAWLSLVGSIFDMAIYPTLFVGYLGH